jgi:hypothetical protein
MYFQRKLATCNTHWELVMTGTLIPLWIIGGPFIGLLILSFSFNGPSAMEGGRGSRSDDRDTITRKNAVPY